MVQKKDSRKYEVRSVTILVLLGLMLGVLPLASFISSSFALVATSTGVAPGSALSHSPILTLNPPAPHHSKTSKARSANPGPPCSSSSPCPVGVTDWGIGPGGSTYSYNAQGAISFVTFNRLYLNGCTSSSGCGMSNQLNAIAEQVYECGNSGCHDGDYWPQDVLEISQSGATTFSVYLLDNIWNFTTGSANMAGLLSLAGSPCNGENYGTARYACATSSFTVSIPFFVEMWMYSYVNPSHNAEIDFYAYVTSGPLHTVVFDARWDNVTFNSRGLANPAGCPFECLNVGGTNGKYGSETDTISNILGGSGGGADIEVPSIQVQMSTGYLPTTSSGYFLAPHAWSSGFTAETSSNIMMTPGSNSVFGETGPDSSIELY